MSEELKKEQDLDGTPESCEETQDVQEPQEPVEEDTVVFTREEAEKMEQLAKDMEQMKDQYLRLAAEYDNYRKRTAKEKQQTYDDAKRTVICDFLAVYDNLERAAAQEGGEDSPHKKGLDMIFRQFEELLAKLGVEKIDAAGQTFDPEQHSAVMHIEDEGLGENVVAEVFQQGFTMNGKVLRFSTVKVAN